MFNDLRIIFHLSRFSPRRGGADLEKETIELNFKAISMSSTFLPLHTNEHEIYNQNHIRDIKAAFVLHGSVSPSLYVIYYVSFSFI